MCSSDLTDPEKPAALKVEPECHEHHERGDVEDVFAVRPDHLRQRHPAEREVAVHRVLPRDRVCARIQTEIRYDNDPFHTGGSEYSEDQKCRDE